MAQFWKQFFESSANVSLSGYEEQPSTHEGIDETLTEESNTTTQTTLDTSESYETPSAQHISTDSIQDLELSNLTISPSHSTPRPARKAPPDSEATTNFANYESPYEALRQEVVNSGDATKLSQIGGPRTPGRPSEKSQFRDIAVTPQSSPELPDQLRSASRPTTTRKKTDPLLHQILDRNYRIQATPMNTQQYDLPRNGKTDDAATPATAKKNRFMDSILSSSPAVPAPQLHAEVFSSPVRKGRTPGVSVLSPAKYQTAKTPGIWDSDDEMEDDFGQSPPKTMQFHVPQSRLLKTPGG